MSCVKPHKSVSSKTLSRWVQETLKEAGVDTSLWDPHSVRAAASAHLRANNMDAVALCKRADWSLTTDTYNRFYKKYV